jgi:hypothetical protein
MLQQVWLDSDKPGGRLAQVEPGAAGEGVGKVGIGSGEKGAGEEKDGGKEAGGKEVVAPVGNPPTCWSPL